MSIFLINLLFYSNNIKLYSFCLYKTLKAHPLCVYQAHLAVWIFRYSVSLLGYSLLFCYSENERERERELILSKFDSSLSCLVCLVFVLMLD